MRGSEVVSVVRPFRKVLPWYVVSLGIAGEAGYGVFLAGSIAAGVLMEFEPTYGVVNPVVVLWIVIVPGFIAVAVSIGLFVWLVRTTRRMRLTEPRGGPVPSIWRRAWGISAIGYTTFAILLLVRFEWGEELGAMPSFLLMTVSLGVLMWCTVVIAWWRGKSPLWAAFLMMFPLSLVAVAWVWWLLFRRELRGTKRASAIR